MISPEERPMMPDRVTNARRRSTYPACAPWCHSAEASDFATAVSTLWKFNNFEIFVCRPILDACELSNACSSMFFGRLHGPLFGVQAVQRRSCTACTAGLANEWSVVAPPKNRGIFAVLLLFKLTVQYRNELYSISDAYGHLDQARPQEARPQEAHFLARS
jgi:hypothetical protein